jgi:PAS domain S-box-containing protein
VVSELAIRLSSSLPDHVDAEISNGLDRILATKGADHVAWSVFSTDGSELRQSYFAHRPGSPQWPSFITDRELPWCARALVRGTMVSIASPDNLPAEADCDKRYLKERGWRSLALVPASSGEIRGVLTLAYRSVSREWPPELISQLQVVGSVLANTLNGKQAQEGRRESEVRFHQLFEEASIGMALEDLEGRLLFVNPALCSMLGYTREELGAMRCSQFSDPQDEEQDWALFQRLSAGQISAYHIEKRYLRKDGARMWGRLHVSLLKNGPSKSPLVIAMVSDITERKAAEEDLRSAKGELQHLAAQLIRAQEEEKQRIARELHDDFGQRLSLLAMELDLIIQDQPVVAPPNRGNLSSLLEQLNELASDIHDLSHRLHSSKLQHLGLSPALADLCRQLSAKGFKVKLDVEEVAGTLSQEIAMCLYRVAQEALNNAMKHSRTSQAAIRLTGRNGLLRMTVKDGGVGFDPKTAAAGLGLASMRERLRVLDGMLVVSSSPGDGTELVAEVPLRTQVVPHAKAG